MLGFDVRTDLGIPKGEIWLCGPPRWRMELTPTGFRCIEERAILGKIVNVGEAAPPGSLHGSTVEAPHD